LQSDPSALESVLRGWQEKGATVAVSCVGTGMHVVFSGKISGARMGRWLVGNGRAGVFLDMHHATGRQVDPTVVPEPVRGYVGTDFVTALELLLETDDECWLGEVRTASST
jgi:hypothetical protein